jgi:cell division protein FtsA
MQKGEELLTVLDAGSSRIRVLVAELHEGALRYRAHSVVNAEGMRKGLISDLQPASRAFNHAATEAEQMANAVIANCVVGLGGPHIRGVNSQGGISLGNRLREITREDVRAAVDRARSVSLPADREIIHLLPQQFILDEQPGIHDPVGMVGNRLEVNLHISTCSASASQSVITCANKAGLEVTDTVFEAIAAAEATVSADERELGACLLDIGAASTELVVFFEGAVAHTAVVPIGGDHFTNDLAVGLHVSVQEAEAIKLDYGHCVVTSVPSSNELELMSGGSQEIRTIKQRYLSEILEPRARELFHMVRENLRQAAYLPAAARVWRVCSKWPKACCAFPPAWDIPCRFPECRTSWYSRSFRQRSACCFTPIAPACCGRRKIRACGPSCALYSQEVCSPGFQDGRI